MLDIFLLSDLQAAEQGSGLVLRGGGSAANTAAWLAYSGAEAGFIGCVGTDTQGSALVQELAGGKVIPRVRTVPDRETGAVLIRIEEDGAERVMRSSRGANMALSPDDIRDADLSDLRCIHLTGYALLGPYGFDLLEAAAQVACDHGALLSFDPSSPGVVEQVGAVSLLQALKHFGVHILLPNREEAAAMTGDEAPVTAARALTECVPVVLVKAGACGAIFADRMSQSFIRTTALRPADPTGAGDAFDAGAITGILLRKPMEQTCRDAMELASRALLQYGGRPVAGDPPRGLTSTMVAGQAHCGLPANG